MAPSGLPYIDCKYFERSNPTSTHFISNRWRNGGKLQQQQEQTETAPLVSAHDSEPLPPPPPYEASASTSKSTTFHSKQSEQFSPPRACVPPTTPRGSKKARHSQLTRQAKRPAVYPRRKKGHHHSSSSSSDPNPSITRSEFDFGKDIQQDEVVEKMDWIGGKLSMLIEQGKKALGSQVVVMSDAKEDEVDDGSAAWEEEESLRVSRSPSRSGSVRHAKRPRGLVVGPASASTTHIQTSGSPSFGFGGLPSSTSAPSTAHSIYGFSGPTFISQQQSQPTSLPTSHSMTSLHHISTEDPASFESPELRQSMERARERLMAKRMGGGGT